VDVVQDPPVNPEAAAAIALTSSPGLIQKPPAPSEQQAPERHPVKRQTL
jgi:hypothetical protein